MLRGQLGAVQAGENRSCPENAVIERLVVVVVGHQRRNDLVLDDPEVLAKDVAEAGCQGVQLGIGDNPAVKAVDRRRIARMLPG